MPNPRLSNTALWLVIIALALFLVEQLAGVTALLASPILMFAIAWLIALIVEPIFGWAERIRIPRSWAVPMVYTALASSIVTGVIALIPIMYDQINRLLLALPMGLNIVWASLEGLQNQLRAIGIQSDIQAIIRIESLLSQFGNLGSTALQQSLELAGGIAQVLFEIIIVFILSFYMAYDRAQLFERIVRVCPPDWRDEAEAFGNIIVQTFGGYMRAQIAISLMYACVNALVMAILGINSITLVTVIVSVLLLIPVVGGPIALIPPVLIALIDAPERIVLFVIIMLIVQQILFNVVVPRMVGRVVGLHPLLVFAALLIGSAVAGAWGILFGIPLAGVAAAITNYLSVRAEQPQGTHPAPHAE